MTYHILINTVVGIIEQQLEIQILKVEILQCTDTDLHSEHQGFSWLPTPIRGKMLYDGERIGLRMCAE